MKSEQPDAARKKSKRRDSVTDNDENGPHHNPPEKKASQGSYSARINNLRDSTAAESRPPLSP